MWRNCVLAIFTTLLFAACTQRNTALPDDFNRRAYALRYVDVDQSLHYADLAYALSSDYPDGIAESRNHRAFVWYQQMLFSRAMEELNRVDSVTSNQVELLCADVMRMKISQRTGELRMFYRAWHNAERRLMRIDEELELLSDHHKERVLYARTEMHIIASTYYFYTQQIAASRKEIHLMDSYMQLPKDTAQWCNYMYMLGDGGLLEGDSILVAIKEFDYLTHVLSLARRRGDRYFQANALQSLSIALESPTHREWIKGMSDGGWDYIIGQYADNVVSEDSLPLVLVEHSLSLFREYRDRFQIANVLRTKAELLFRQGCYAEALAPLKEALDIVEEQHRNDAKCVPYWEARIYERLSLTYSALGMRDLALEARGIYLSLLSSTRQNLEKDVRAEELQTYNNRLYISLSVVAAMVLVVIAVFWLLLRRLKKRTLRQEREAEETLQLTKDETCAREMELAREKLLNIERRANVSLAENVVPYINRMLHTHDMEYVSELSAEILRINNILTEWIQVKRGMVAVNISTFALQPLLNTIARNRATFQRRNLILDIPQVDVSVKADRALTLFMINTLCDNARKFTPSGGRISITVDASDTVVEISVRDTGCGLSPENVDTINNSKVYRIQPSDPVHQTGAEGHGFGFGLMNCRGIIEQMKKLSSRFSCCDFGVESTEGQGSRFWFRLPRVLGMVMAFCIGLSAWAQDTDPADAPVYYREDASSEHEPQDVAEVEPDYDAAWEAYQSLCNSNAKSRYREAIDYGHLAIALVPKDSIVLRMHIENEMAFASQSVCLWNEYRYHNAQCSRLHRILTEDPNLPAYAQQLHTLKSEISGVQFLMIVLFMCSAFFLVLVIRRSRRRRGEMLRQEDMQELQNEALNRVQYELDRVHIQNRILDNCLSTIKHETMYYPARIQHMAQGSDVDAGELSQLIHYYSDVYTILLEQAQRQIPTRLALDESLLAELKRRIMSAIGNVPSTVSVTEKDNIMEIRVRPLQAHVPNNLFTPDAGNLDAFVAREIVRMHDAACGYPGLRLYVDNNEIIITLWKNSRLSSLRTFSWS